MNIHFKTGSEEIAPRTLERTEKKLRKLGKLVHDDGQEALVAVGFMRESGSNSSERLWRVSIQLTRPGLPDVHASATGASPEAASERTTAELKAELLRLRGKQHSLLKRGGQLLKRLTRRH
jgi:hypothetical protein